MAGNGPTAATSPSAGAIVMFGLSFVVGLISLVFIGILVTMALPMLGGFAGIAILVTGPIAGFIGAIGRDRSWRWGYGCGLVLDEIAILGLQLGSDGPFELGTIALVVVPPTIAGWMVGLYVARHIA